jgi:hypothetical protein
MQILIAVSAANVTRCTAEVGITSKVVNVIGKSRVRRCTARGIRDRTTNIVRCEISGDLAGYSTPPRNVVASDFVSVSWRV